MICETNIWFWILIVIWNLGYFNALALLDINLKLNPEKGETILRSPGTRLLAQILLWILWPFLAIQSAWKTLL